MTNEVSRRNFLQASLALGGAAALAGIPMATYAQENQPVRGYGTTTVQLKDWGLMEKSINVKMEYTPTNSDIGNFLREIISNDVGSNHDLFFMDGGNEDVLGPQGYYAELIEDQKELTLWARTPDVWKRSELVRAEGKQYGIPIVGNADCFGYSPAEIGVNPNGLDEVPWSKMFDDDQTRGKAAIDRSWVSSIAETANYLNYHGKVKVGNPADLEANEAKQVVDFLVERKKAGQFRTIFSAFEEQVQLLSNKEVSVLNCWEPAVHEANQKLGPNATAYAFTVEGYYKWAIGAYVHKKAIERGDNVDNIYKVLNYFLDGEYRAYQAKDRGYAGPNMDLGVKYAVDHNWDQKDIDAIKWTEQKVAKKFQKGFDSVTTPKNGDVMEEEWQRFLNA